MCVSVYVCANKLRALLANFASVCVCARVSVENRLRVAHVVVVVVVGVHSLRFFDSENREHSDDGGCSSWLAYVAVCVCVCICV